MSSEVERLQSDLADSQATARGYKELLGELEKRRDVLLAEVDALEAVVARLEAEDLQPLVDRLRSHSTSIKKLVEALAQAVSEISEE